MPVRATFVLPLMISHSQGAVRDRPLGAGSRPSPAASARSRAIKLKIGRNYTYRGQRRSFLSASCAAPAGFPGAIFPFARGSFHFADGRKLDTTLTRDCRVR